MRMNNLIRVATEQHTYLDIPLHNNLMSFLANLNQILQFQNTHPISIYT